MAVADRPVRARHDEVELLQNIDKLLQEFRSGVQSDNRESGTSMAVLVNETTSQKLEIPSSLFEVIYDAVDILLKGGAVAIMPYHAQLTTQEAADYLGVSRPYLITLLEKGEIPFKRLRSHRRIMLRDLEEYRLHRDEARHQALDALTGDVYDAGLYDVTHEAEPDE